ncbi:MAG: hypothetical protein EBU73_09445 [Chitinophagia bacterium]|nr:hypothetical protein [Chitinophagia bacterium]
MPSVSGSDRSTRISPPPDDKVVPIENSFIYVDALKSNGVEAELFVYETGGHGFGMVNKTSSENWMGALKSWMQKNKIIE